MGCDCFRGNFCFSRKWNVTFLVLGLDGSGKTIITRRIVGEKVDTLDGHMPTVGLNTWKTNYRRSDVTFYDIGGGSGIRGIWKLYFQEAHGFIYVVDSTDQGRIGECREALLDCVRSLDMRGKPLLVLGNKQDVEGAMDEMDLCEALSLEREVNEAQTPTRIELCSGLKSTGGVDRSIRMGFKWLLETVKKNYLELNERVQTAVKRREEEDMLRITRARERQRRFNEEELSNENPAFDGAGEANEVDGSNAHFAADMAGANPFRPLRELSRELDVREQASRSRQNDGDGVEQVLGMTDRTLPGAASMRVTVAPRPPSPSLKPPLSISSVSCKRLPPLRGRRPISPPIQPKMEKRNEDEGEDGRGLVACDERASPEGMESERATADASETAREVVLKPPACLKELPPLYEVDSPARPKSVWGTGSPIDGKEREDDAKKRAKKKRWNQTSQPSVGILKSRNGNKIAPSLSISSSSVGGAPSPAPPLPVMRSIGSDGLDAGLLRPKYRNGVTFSGDVLVRKRSASVSPPRSPQKPLFGADWTPPGSSGGVY